MRVAVKQVKDGDAQALRLRRQHRRADGDLALRAEDAGRHRPAGDRDRCCPTRRTATPTCWTSAPTSIARPSTCCSSRVMGARWSRAVERKERPTRRPAQHRRRRHQGQRDRSSRRPSCCARAALNFYGNVEGDDIFKGTTDVVVCDGFVGNVAAEDLRRAGHDARRLPARGIHAQRRSPSSRHWSRRPVLKRFKSRVDHRRYNGAALLGLRGIVIKSHGSADAFAFGRRYADARAARRRATAACRSDIAERHARSITEDERRMHSIRASSAPAATCPRRSSRNRRSRDARRRDVRRMDRRAHRHPRATSPRRIMTASDLALRRARRALEAAAVGAAGHRPDHRRDHRRRDMVFPSTACILQAKLGIDGCAAFDVQAVCSGFVYALSVADHLIEAGAHRSALVVGAEVYLAHPRLEATARPACCSATAPAPWCSSASETPGILASDLHADGSHVDILCVPGHVDRRRDLRRRRCCKMDGQAVFKLAVRRAREVARRDARARPGSTRADIDWLIPHQANIRIMEARRRSSAAAWKAGRRPSTSTATRRRPRFRSRSTKPCATARSARPHA